MNVYLVYRDHIYGEETLFAAFSKPEAANACADYMNEHETEEGVSYRYEVAGLDVWELPSEERASV